MSRRASRRLLWVGMLLTLPCPLLVVGPGLVPPARLAMLGAVAGSVMAFERSSGVVGLLTAILLGQALLYGLLLWGGAALLARGLARLGPRALGAGTLLLVAGLVAATASQELYRTPFAADAPRASLLGVYR